ncbi:hypothetical protein FRC03_010236 [Tulasnella sp. 419]|nr:hypothetical protein FRC03_010236 [Tulasnella sp. 419]
MGNASSKAARKFPTKPSWAGARTDIPSEASKRASEFKSPAIEQDAMDPHFLANLSKVGPVKVPYASTAFRPSFDPIQNALKIRQKSEEQASQYTPTRNKLLVADLGDFLDLRKQHKTSSDIQALLSKYNVDPQILSRVVKYVNTPSIGETITSRKVTADGEQMILMKAAWIDPR